MTRPIDIVLPDAGPLISLGHADRLDLLTVFERPVKLLDVVVLECLRKPNSPDHATLRRWFEKPSNLVEIVTTPMRPLYDDMLRKERSGEDPTATRGMGDVTLVWAMRNLDRFTDTGAVALVLVEDRTVASTIRRTRAHILSTRAWLTGLERAGLIPSAAAVVNDINMHGRHLSAYEADEPFVDDGGQSSWIDTFGRKAAD